MTRFTLSISLFGLLNQRGGAGYLKHFPTYQQKRKQASGFRRWLFHYLRMKDGGGGGGGGGATIQKNTEHFKIIQEHLSNFMTVEVFKVRKIWFDGGISQESSRKGLKF